MLVLVQSYVCFFFYTVQQLYLLLILKYHSLVFFLLRVFFTSLLLLLSFAVFIKWFAFDFSSSFFIKFLSLSLFTCYRRWTSIHSFPLCFFQQHLYLLSVKTISHKNFEKMMKLRSQELDRLYRMWTSLHWHNFTEQKLIYQF